MKAAPLCLLLIVFAASIDPINGYLMNLDIPPYNPKTDPNFKPMYYLHNNGFPTHNRGRNLCGRPTLSNKFTLSLQYGRRNGITEM